MALQRLQKILARAGISSRRAAELLIEAGKVRVNGTVVTQLGTRADPEVDKVEVDGVRAVAEAPLYLILHKPRAVVSTLSDPEGRKTVADLVSGISSRVYPVGRLDFQTSGALMLSNDGDFAARMLHPHHHVPKTYLVKVRGEMGDADVERWAKGVQLEDGITAPADVRVVRREPGRTWLEVELYEGRNQQIRRMGEATGFTVLRLTRLAFAGISIDGLRPGSWRLLNFDELKGLRELYGVPKRIRPAMTDSRELERGPTRRERSKQGGLPRRDSEGTKRKPAPRKAEARAPAGSSADRRRAPPQDQRDQQRRAPAGSTKREAVREPERSDRSPGSKMPQRPRPPMKGPKPGGKRRP